jgi:hypothetical protein
MVKRGRGADQRGEKNGNHKLTSEQVMEIHRLHATGAYTQTELGRRFGVSEALIRFIVRGERWPEEYELFHGLQPGADSRENTAVA